MASIDAVALHAAARLAASGASWQTAFTAPTSGVVTTGSDIRIYETGPAGPNARVLSDHG